MHRQLSEITTTAEQNQTSAEISANKFSYRCFLRPLRLMWQVSVLSSKVADTLGCVYKYAQDSLDSFLCVADGKARRKDRDGDQNSTDAKLYLEESVLERKLPEADLKVLVDLPAGLDYNEWLASHTLALFEHVNLVYGTISEFCTPSGCADMIGPGNRTYLWFDEKGKKTRVAAPQYIDYVMIFTQKTVSDESIFPTKYANEFPSSFESIARKILRLQFHVIAHLYAVHFREIALLGLHTHLNLTFAHLTALHRRFNLIDEKETDVLRDLELALRLTDDFNAATTTTSTNNLIDNNTLPTTTTATTTNVGSNNINNENLIKTTTTTATHTTTTSTTMMAATTSNNSNCNNNNHNYNNHNYHQQQQQQINGENDNVTKISTITNLNDVMIMTTNNLDTTTIIDGDASVPPICAQPETKPNKLTIICNNSTTGSGSGSGSGNGSDLQQQFMYNNKTTTNDHVHTRLIQCNSSTAPSILTMHQQQQQQ